jgi:hypothetical protein
MCGDPARCMDESQVDHVKQVVQVDDDKEFTPS